MIKSLRLFLLWVKLTLRTLYRIRTVYSARCSRHWDMRWSSLFNSDSICCVSMNCKGAEDVKGGYQKQVTCALCDLFSQRLCILTLKIHWFNSLQSSLRGVRDWGLKQLRWNAYMCVNFKLEYNLTLRHNCSRADLINLAYFLSQWYLRKMWVIDNSVLWTWVCWLDCLFWEPHHHAS
jgi:hypothetical protein